MKLLTAALFVALFVAACGKDTGTGGQPAAEPNYKWLSANVIGPKCLECHGAGKKVPFTNYAQVVKWVIPGKSNASPLYQAITAPDTNPMKMPKNRTPLAQTETEAFKAWIDSGAKESSTPTTK